MALDLALDIFLPSFLKCTYFSDFNDNHLRAVGSYNSSQILTQWVV